jgi:outer membrane protein OmpA-like peptidoglycan-associated protein
MKKWIGCLVLFAGSLPGLAQSLLLNGGFEEINTCTEFKIECSPEAWISNINPFANFFRMPSRAHKSSNCMSVQAGHFERSNQRSFLRTTLPCGLRKGARYQLRFYVKSWHDVLDSTGLLFTATDPLFDKENFYKKAPDFFLQGHIAPPPAWQDSAWRKVDLIYTANGEEQYLMLGYFAKEEFFDERVTPMENRFYIFFDDFSMVPMDPGEEICRGWEKSKEDIYDENERHEMLQKKIKYYRDHPPLTREITRTSVIVIDTLVLPDILFQTGKANLQPQSFVMLDSFARRMKKTLIDSVVIEGHTDNVGSGELNEKLSFDRAMSVKKYLETKTGYRNIIARGLSFLKPIADNETPEGRQRNRRVEALLYIRE